MKNIYLTTLTTLLFASSAVSQNDEFNTADFRRVASSIGFEGAKNLKGLSQGELLQFYSNTEEDRAMMKQININSWGVCDHYNIDNFDTYNYYYKDITREKYNQYCKEINALMLLDGTITQLK